MGETRLEGGPKVIYPSRWIADVRLVRDAGHHNIVIRMIARLCTRGGKHTPHVQLHITWITENNRYLMLVEFWGKPDTEGRETRYYLIISHSRAVHTFENYE